MKTKKHCLYCYEALVNEIDFHERCALEFFGTTTPPELPYGITEMDALIAYLQMLGTLVDFSAYKAEGPELR